MGNLFDTYRATRNRYYAHDGKSNGPRNIPMRAVEALPLAKATLAAGKPRYYTAKSDYGPLSGCIDQYPFLQHLGNVNTESYGHDWKSKHDSGGWYTEPDGATYRDGSGLCFGVVYAMRKQGKVLFIPGFEFGGVDGGPDLDFSKSIEVDNEKDHHIPFVDYDAAGKVARVADDLAKNAAEKEREYQSAWRAGTIWADAKQEAASLRADTLALLRERRAAKGLGSFPALCDALKATISGNVREIAKLRDKCAKLAKGDGIGRDCEFYFYPSEDLISAFNEGAGSTVLEF